MQTNPIPARILGFSRIEWGQARFDDPVATEQFLAFFDAATSTKGGLAGVGVEAILAIARVSPAFSRRLRAYYDSIDSHWRTNLPRDYLVAFTSGTEDPRLEIVSSQWAAILALLEASDTES